MSYSLRNRALSYSWLDIFLVYLSFGMINPTVQQFKIVSIGLFLFVGLIFLLKKKKVDRVFAFLFFGLVTLLIAQAIKFGNYSLTSFVGQFMIFLFPYFIYRLVGERFVPIFIRLLYYFSIFGLIMWAMANLFDPFHVFLQELVRFLGTDPASGESFLIYNIDWHRADDWLFMKNPGPFNEGGVYSCFLIFAIVLNVFTSGILWERRNLVFMASIITTTSTAGYAALFSLILLFYFYNGRLAYRIFVVPVVAALGVFSFFELPFLYEKIESQFVHQTSLSIDSDVRVGRFHSALVGLKMIQNNPLFGRGLYREDRFLSEKEKEKGVTGSLNGVVDIISKIGIPIGFLYFILLYKSLGALRIRNDLELAPMLGFIPILIVGMAQNPFNSPVYLIFVYLFATLSRVRKGTLSDSNSLKVQVQNS